LSGIHRSGRKNGLSGSLRVYIGNLLEGISMMNLLHQLTTMPIGQLVHQQVDRFANRLTHTPNVPVGQ
jgi:hypothetical protein